jgi:hypothetical protein
VFSCQEKEKTTKKETKPNKSITISKSKENLEKDTITIEYLYEYNPYDYDTKLRNGYKLEFSYFQKHKDSVIEMCLTLNKKEKIIDTLNIMGYGAPHKNLGYIGADFEKYFAFVNSFGSGNPHEYRLIKKLDGRTVKTGFIIDSFNNPDFLLYAKGYDSIMLYDVKKEKDFLIERLSNSKEIDCMVSDLCDVLKIKKVTNNYVQIDINNYDKKKITKKYYR